MASRDINLLNKTTRDKFLLFREKMTARDLPFIVTCTARTDLEQLALYAQGRVSLLTVNRVRHLAGLPQITDEANRRSVTWTLNSRHIVHENRPLADAFDIALTSSGRVHWDVKADVNDDEIPDYLEAAQIARECGLMPGADFKTPDWCHFQNKED